MGSSTRRVRHSRDLVERDIVTVRTVSIEAAKRRLHARLNAEFGDVQPSPAEVQDNGPEKAWIHVEFHDHRPSHILPILAVVTEYGRGISTITHNMKARRR